MKPLALSWARREVPTFRARPDKAIKETTMAVSDYQLLQAWQQVLTLSRLEKGQTVTILTSASTHPQTLAMAQIAAQSMGAVVNRLDLPPVNAEKSLSRDPL